MGGRTVLDPAQSTLRTDIAMIMNVSSGRTCEMMHTGTLVAMDLDSVRTLFRWCQYGIVLGPV